MRKPDFCLCKNKGADQLLSAQLISAFFLLNGQYNSSSTYFKILALFSDHTDQFASHLVGNPEDRFTRVAAHISMFYVQ